MLSSLRKFNNTTACGFKFKMKYNPQENGQNRYIVDYTETNLGKSITFDTLSYGIGFYIDLRELKKLAPPDGILQSYNYYGLNTSDTSPYVYTNIRTAVHPYICIQITDDQNNTYTFEPKRSDYNTTYCIIKHNASANNISMSSSMKNSSTTIQSGDNFLIRYRYGGVPVIGDGTRSTKTTITQAITIGTPSTGSDTDFTNAEIRSRAVNYNTIKNNKPNPWYLTKGYCYGRSAETSTNDPMKVIAPELCYGESPGAVNCLVIEGEANLNTHSEFLVTVLFKFDNTNTFINSNTDVTSVYFDPFGLPTDTSQILTTGLKNPKHVINNSFLCLANIAQVSEYRTAKKDPDSTKGSDKYILLFASCNCIEDVECFSSRYIPAIDLTTDPSDVDTYYLNNPVS